MSEIDRAFTDLDHVFWPRYVAATLSALHRQYGSPARQMNTMNQGLKTLPFISYAAIGPLSGYEKDAVDAYNDVVKLSYACIGWEFIGLCSALVYGAPRTRQPWDEYVSEGEQILDAYFRTEEAFNDFEAYILEPARGAVDFNPTI